MSDFFTTETSDPRFESDGLRMVTVKSNALKSRADLTLFDSGKGRSKAGVPVVILLHGVYGSHWVWSRKAGVHRTCQQMIDEGQIRPLVLVMPSDGLHADGSGYLRHAKQDFEKWIVEDVIQVAREQVPGVSSESPFFITGFSMGGFGALRIGSKYPQLFSAFSGLSSITHFDQMKEFVKDFEDLKQSAAEQDGVLEWMLRHRDTLPPFRFDCGVDDSLIEYNRKLHSQLIEEKIPHEYQEFPGTHEWDYWERHIKDSLVFFDKHY